MRLVCFCRRFSKMKSDDDEDEEQRHEIAAGSATIALTRVDGYGKQRPFHYTIRKMYLHMKDAAKRSFRFPPDHLHLVYKYGLFWTIRSVNTFQCSVARLSSPLSVFGGREHPIADTVLFAPAGHAHPATTGDGRKCVLRARSMKQSIHPRHSPEH